MINHKKTPSGGDREGAKKLFYGYNYIQKIKSGQTDSAYWLELLSENSHCDPIYLPASHEAKSLLLIYEAKQGLTRKEALGKHFVLSLTQHVAWLRHELDLNIWTERVGQRRYANYHLLTPLKINIYHRRDS